MLSVINSRNGLSPLEATFLENTYKAFNNQSDPSNPKLLRTYLERKRPFILAWVSPTDGAVSMSWLNPPGNWDPEKEYPLYIQLHGLWGVASNSIEYMTYPFLQGPSTSNSFEDGYLLSPWGRGNYWYQGISETDIWECMAALEALVKINPDRKYLSGHSMGGYGAWSIASKSPDTWAALGIHAGALQYGNPNLVNPDVAAALNHLPVYFVCGTEDGLMEINTTAYELLGDAGNPNLQFVTFTGGHEYKEQNVYYMYLWLRGFVRNGIGTEINSIRKIAQEELSIRCYPNPAKSMATILYSGIKNPKVSISLCDMYGRFIGKVADAAGLAGANSITFDVTGLKPGMYFVHIRSGDVTADSKMVVIK
jgi:predicted esterase